MKLKKIRLVEADDLDIFDLDLNGEVTPEEVIKAYKDGIRRTPHDHWLDLGRMKMKHKIPVPCPHTIKKSLNCMHNDLNSFEHFPKNVYGEDGIDVSYNNFSSLKDIHKHLHSVTGKDGIILSHNPLKSHLLGLLKINGLKKVVLTDASGSKALHEAQRIINKYLPGNGSNKDIMDCQSDLLDAGLDEYAQL